MMPASGRIWGTWVSRYEGAEAVEAVSFKKVTESMGRGNFFTF